MDALLLILLGLLQMADGTVTYLGIKGDSVDEANPVAEWCFEYVGLGCSITAVKLAVVALIALIFFRRRQLKRRFLTATLSLLVSFYSWVVANNMMLVFAS